MKEERRVLKELKSAPGTVIKNSDKGRNVIIMNDHNYVAEVGQLKDESAYLRLTNNPFAKLVKELNYKLTLAMLAGLLSKKELEYLRVYTFKIYFYIIPKIHKDPLRQPGRPIVSPIGGLLVRVWKYLDLLVKNMVYFLPSYVKDTGDVLNNIQELEILHGALLMWIDFESLYTSIPY